MKKLLATLGISVLALAACNSHHANAQSQISNSATNADSSGVMVVEEEYEAVVATPADTQPASSPADNSNMNNASNASADNNPTMVTEAVSETVTPNAVSYEAEEIAD